MSARKLLRKESGTAAKAAAKVVHASDKNFLTESEMKRFLDAARGGRYGVRDYLMMLLTYRHELRVSELIDIRIKDLDLETHDCMCVE